MDAHLQARLERVAQLQRRTRLALKLAACWAGAALAGGVLIGLVRPDGGSLPWWPLPTVVLLGVVAAFISWASHRRIPTDWRNLACRIESAYPALNGRLLTAIQQEAREGGRFNFLQERLVREVLVHAHRHSWTNTVSRPRILASGLLHALTLLCFLGVLWALRPGAAPSPFAVHTPTGPEVVPGDAEVERGASLVILARFDERRVPSTAELLIAGSNGPARQLTLVRSLADPVFGTTVPDIDSGFVYQVRYDGERTRQFRVSVFEHPRLEKSDADLSFPEYTGLAPRRIENTRRVTAVEQSRVGLLLQLNKAVASAQLVPRGTNPGPVVDLVVSSNVPVASLSEFPLLRSQSYDLRLLDYEGRTNKAAALFVLEALPNRQPELKLARPRGDLRPSPLEEIAFEGTAWDDFGVSAYGLGYTIAGAETRFLELGRSVPGGEKRPFQHLLSLEELSLEPDQLISWFVWAEDVGPDGRPRRSAGDLFFGEIRPFDEVFREGQGMDGAGQQEQQGGQQPGQGSPSSQLAELQKKIMSATWRLQREQGTLDGISPSDRKEEPRKEAPARKDSIRSSAVRVSPPVLFAASRPVFGQQRETRRPAAAARSQEQLSRPSGSLADDAAVIRDAQAQALSQAEEAREAQQDQRAEALWSAAAREMQRALDLLEKAPQSPQALAEALAAEQAAYQALLRLQEHEHQVSRARRQRGQQGNSSREQQMRSQLDQLELSQSENRYETERQAQRPQSAERREQLQVMNRLEELARRQQDLNERLKELQAALQAAADEKQREELRRQLKRLQEEQQQLVADADELQQRMQSPENQSRMADERRQMEQAREELQRAAEAASQGAVSQALASGTRAQRQLQEMREQMRRESSSQFAQDLREMRSQARQLSRDQEQLLKEMQNRATSEPGKLSLSLNQQELIDRLDRQQQLLTNVLDRAAQVSRDSEPTEPLLSRQLYDTLRKFNQDSAQDLKQAQEELLRRGMMTRSLYEQLQDRPGQDGAKMMDLTGELLGMNFPESAAQTGERSRDRLDQLKLGVERASESVLGDDTEALRLAEKELEQLTKQVQDEIAQAGGQEASTNQVAGRDPGEPGQGQPRPNDDTERSPGQSQEPRPRQASNDPPPASRQEPASGGESARQQASSAPQPNPQAGQAEQASAEPQQSQDPTPGEPTGTPGREGEGRQPGEPREAQNQAAQSGQASSGPRRGIDLDQLLRGAEGRGGSGPMLGDAFVDWSDRLRDVEEMVDTPELRTGIATARERARLIRRDVKRDGKSPDWAQVRLQVVNPLVEVRNQIAEELARRNSSEALVPVDRDPVPSRYSDLVRRYYEALGKD